jgi:hypothetical protein
MIVAMFRANPPSDVCSRANYCFTVTTCSIPQLKSKLLYNWQPVSQYVLVSSPLCEYDQILLPVGRLLSESCGLVSVRRPLWREDWSAICSAITHAEPVTILYCLIWDSLNLEGQVPVFISPRNRVAQLVKTASQLCRILFEALPLHTQDTPYLTWTPILMLTDT